MTPDLYSTRSYPPSELVRYDLGWHEPPWMPQSVREMHKQAQWFLNDLAHRNTGTVSPRWLTLCGHSGCGKTYLATAIRTAARAQLGFTEATAQLRNASIYANKLRDGEFGLQSFLISIPLLVLDDLGAEYKSDYIRSQLYELLDARLNKWTVITSNLSLSDIADRLDVRIASRIKRGENVIVESKDPFDFCYMAKKENYIIPKPKKQNDTIPTTNTEQQNETPTPQEQAEFTDWLRTEVRLYADQTKHQRTAAAKTRIPR